MKIILLAAGYGTRVYPYTLDCPKALLAIKGKPLLDYLLDKIPDQPIHLVSNEKFFPHFKKWLSEYQGLKKPRIKLI
jgi:NDP-sugar pyrophosphorylase family protein